MDTERFAAYEGPDDELSLEDAFELFEEHDRVGLFDGDKGDLGPEARYALTRLVRDRYVSDELATRYHTSCYQLIIEHRDEIERNLNNLCLKLNLNEKYRVAWASTAPFDGPMCGVVLKRNVVQKRDVTVLLVALRIVAQNAELDGRERAYIDFSDIEASFTTLSPYEDTGDAQLVRRRIDAAVAEALTCGYLEETEGVEGRYRILPIVSAMLTLERALELVDELKGMLAKDSDEGKGE